MDEGAAVFLSIFFLFEVQPQTHVAKASRNSYGWLKMGNIWMGRTKGESAEWDSMHCTEEQSNARAAVWELVSSFPRGAATWLFGTVCWNTRNPPCCPWLFCLPVYSPCHAGVPWGRRRKQVFRVILQQTHTQKRNCVDKQAEICLSNPTALCRELKNGYPCFKADPLVMP